MVKRFFGHICLILATVLILCSFGVYAADTPDNKVGLEIKFDYDKYVVGETAEATIKLTGLTDEKAANYSLSAFQTQLEFNTDELEVTSMGFDKDLSDAIKESEKDFTVTSKRNNIITVFFAVDKGIKLSDIAPNGEITIGKIKFKIKKTNGGVSVKFETANYKTEIIRPFEDSPKGYLLECNSYTGASANIVKYGAIISQGARISENKITDSVKVSVEEQYKKPMLIARLYDNSGLTKNTKVFTLDNIGGKVSFTENIEFSVSGLASPKIEYFLWEGFSSMKPICDSVPAKIN